MNLNTIASLFSQAVPTPCEITGISTDSRHIQPGNLFIALSGDAFDGHDYIHEVEKKGAAAVVVTHRMAGITIPQIVVDDTIMALATIAEAHRNQYSCPVIALTGSNGKTTVKEMIAAILPVPSHATRGNLNNHIGAPLSVLELNHEHQYAVFELGASHKGEIKHTVAIVQPDVTLINNIAPAHVEGFGSIDGVASAKGEIHQGLSATGTAIINDDDAYAHFWDNVLTNKRVLHFSANHRADIYAENSTVDSDGCSVFSLIMPSGRTDIHLQVPGLHNLRNALAAASCCFAVGISIEAIQKGLNNFRGVRGRMTFFKGKNQSTIIDDTYNANLQSTLMALEVLARRPGKKIFVFGDMGELGAWSIQHHEEVGLAARHLGIDRLLSCGIHSQFAAEAFGSEGIHCSTQEDLAHILLSELNPDTTILVKGSRSSAMEKIVNKLLK